MSQAEKPVLLVGGVPGNTAEEVFRTVAPELGDLALGLTDGEIGVRRIWVLFVAYNTWHQHPDLETVRKPRGIPGMPEYVPSGYDDLYIFTPKQGVEAITVDTLYYPAEATASYDVFCKLRNEGVIPQDVRFQQCLPFPEDACRLFTANARDADVLVAAYLDAMKRDVARICQAIPHDDLVLQWDINWEVIAIETNDGIAGREPVAFKMNGDPVERYARYVKELSKDIPTGVKLGLHLCYGDLHHRHFLEPQNLAVSVRLANLGVQEAGRRIDYVHMSVPRSRSDDAYFAPLKNADLKNATLYIGLVHYTDGIAGTRTRLAAFKRYYDGPSGVATECGLGRRPPEQDLKSLLRLHREAVAGL